MAPATFCSLSLSEAVPLMPSGYFGGTCFFKSLVASTFPLCLLAGIGGEVLHTFGITLGTICAPKDDPHHLGSLNLLENVLLIPSGCFLGPCSSNSEVSSVLSLCVCLLALERGCSNVFEITLRQVVLP